MGIDDLVVQELQHYVPGWGCSVPYLRIRRYDWGDGIPWELLQQAKDEAGYADCAAIEVYPPACDVVNEVNIRHLWVLPHHIDYPNLNQR